MNESIERVLHAWLIHDVISPARTVRRLLPDFFSGHVSWDELAANIEQVERGLTATADTLRYLRNTIAPQSRSVVLDQLIRDVVAVRTSDKAPIVIRDLSGCAGHTGDRTLRPPVRAVSLRIVLDNLLDNACWEATELQKSSGRVEEVALECTFDAESRVIKVVISNRAPAVVEERIAASKERPRSLQWPRGMFIVYQFAEHHLNGRLDYQVNWIDERRVVVMATLIIPL